MRGGAVYGCRAEPAAPEANKACLYADNLRNGQAFLFRSREGSTVGHFDLGNPAGPPFTTNATGLAENLNADKVDGKDASDLVGATGPAGPQGPQGPKGDKGDKGDPGPTASNAVYSGTDVDVSGDSSQVMETSITVPFDSRILASASAELFGNGGTDDDPFCWLSKDASGSGDDISGRMRMGIADTATADRAVISMDGSMTAPAGTHTIRVFCSVTSGNATFDEGNLNVWAIAS